ncbi:MAG TPA: addiction module protein [Thermoanaerobaculia bacterium]|nr:addiction module protein [Thermoanaerobaculia bacterium]
MARKLGDIAAEALELERESRAALAKTLLDSLDEPSADEVGKGWVSEAERRYQDLKSGRARTLPSEEVFAKLESREKR